MIRQIDLVLGDLRALFESYSKLGDTSELGLPSHPKKDRYASIIKALGSLAGPGAEELLRKQLRKKPKSKRPYEKKKKKRDTMGPEDDTEDEKRFLAMLAGGD